MRRSLFTVFIFALSLASQANAWDMDMYVENAKASEETDSTKATAQFPQATHGTTATHSTTATRTNDEFKRHSISVGYGILTISDFVGAIAVSIVEIIDGLAGNDDGDDFGWLGTFMVDYGYRLDDHFELGGVFGYSQPVKNTPMFTLMPKGKLNFNNGGFVNPFMELDAGVIFNGNGAAPIFHATLLGLEIGRRFPLTLGLLAFGQRGMWYATIGHRF